MSRHAAAKAPLLKPVPKPSLDTKAAPATDKVDNCWLATATAAAPATSQAVPMPRRNWHLFQAGYAKSTTDRYRSATQDFTAWCKASGLKAQTFEELDVLLTDYVHDLYDANDGRGRQKAVNTVYGCQMFMPQCKDKLPLATQAVARWSKKHPSISHPPLQWEAAVLMAVQLARHKQFRYAVALLLAFDCMLRIEEFMQLKKCDVADGAGSALGARYRAVTLRLATTKTGKDQSVNVRQDCVKTLLRQVLADTKDSQGKLFPGGAAAFRAWFVRVRNELGLNDRLVPHSLRHGGATWRFLAGESVENIMVEGRWASSKSARTYIQKSRAVLLANAIPSKLAKTAANLAEDVVLSIALAQKH